MDKFEALDASTRFDRAWAILYGLSVQQNNIQKY